MRTSPLLGWIAAITLVTGAAAADPLVVDTVEYGSWPSAIARLDALSAASAPRQIHVRVRDSDGRVVACGGYSLAVDGAGAAAFGVRACDPTTQATSLEIVNHAALFDQLTHRSNAVQITATELRRAQSVDGGAPADPSGGGSGDSCDSRGPAQLRAFST